jgi:hypothetical protein
MDIDFLHKNNMFKLQITLNRYSPILVIKDCHLSDPPHFSLLSTFKARVWRVADSPDDVQEVLWEEVGLDVVVLIPGYCDVASGEGLLCNQNGKPWFYVCCRWICWGFYRVYWACMLILRRNMLYAEFAQSNLSQKFPVRYYVYRRIYQWKLLDHWADKQKHRAVSTIVMSQDDSFWLQRVVKDGGCSWWLQLIVASSDCSWWLQPVVASVQLFVGRQGVLLQVTSQEEYFFYKR